MRKLTGALFEFSLISGLLLLAVVVLPFFLLKWRLMPSREVDGAGWFMPNPNPKRSSGGVGDGRVGG